jgi:hypothetical protein
LTVTWFHELLVTHTGIIHVHSTYTQLVMLTHYSPLRG